MPLLSAKSRRRPHNGIRPDRFRPARQASPQRVCVHFIVPNARRQLPAKTDRPPANCRFESAGGIRYRPRSPLAGASRVRIAVMPGDGVGKEVVPEGLKVLQAAADKFAFKFATKQYPHGAEYYLATGVTLPDQ